MAKKFDIAAFAAQLEPAVSNSDTAGREQIEYIDISLLDGDPKNFYNLPGIDELASNIQFCGLQQPLRVRPVGGGRYAIASGHRRRAALQKLVEEGLEEYRQVPCLLDRPAVSPALEELRLIFGNSDNRHLTTPELSKQAERVEMLLYQLKEQGVNFPGRMRDQVAAACQTSASKLARLKVIRENLDAGLGKHWEKGELSESVAYALAQQPPELQKKVKRQLYIQDKAPKNWSEWRVKDAVKTTKAISAWTCPKKLGGGPCTNADAVLAHIADTTYSYHPCQHVTCCDKCDKLATCKAACPKLAEKVKTLRLDKREANRQAKEAQEEKDRPTIEKITTYWVRFSQAREAAGKSVKGWFKHMDMYFDKDKSEKDYADWEQGRRIKRDTDLPYGYCFSLSDAEKLRKAADYLGVSLDYLLCRTDDPAQVEPLETDGNDAPQRPVVRWESRGATPPIGQMLLTCELTNEGPKLTPAVWNGVHFHAPGNVSKILTGLHFTQWLAVPMAHSGQAFDVDLEPVSWRTDKDYPRGHWVAVMFDMGGDSLVRKVLHVSETGKLEFRPGLNADGIKPVGWVPLPSDQGFQRNGGSEEEGDPDAHS